MIGHNGPPHIIALEAARDYVTRCEALQVIDAASSAEAARLIDEEVKARKAADAARTAEKAPHLEKCRTIDADWKPVPDTLAQGVAIVKARALAWRKAEADRIAREAEEARLEQERQQEAAIRALQAAEAPDASFADEVRARLALAEADAAEERAQQATSAAPPKLVADGIRARGVRLTWSVDVIDAAAMVAALADHPDVIAAAAKVAAARVRVEKDALKIPGVKPVATETI